jgi:RNA polymerase sigma factor (sigma-70 family)
MLAQPESRSEALRRVLESIETQTARIFLRFRIPVQDAEDILQDSLLAYLTCRTEIANLEAWMLGTLRNRCYLYWRARRRQLWEAVDATVLTELAAESTDDGQNSTVRHDLTNAIGRLPKRCRSILQLRYGLDCDGAEIAERLGYRPSSMRQITNRCIAALTIQLVSRGYGSERVIADETEPAHIR